MHLHAGRPRRQRGAVLVIGLIFLTMLTLMGVAAYSVATQEEKMSGNARDLKRAFEAAESSLRDCEAVIGGFGSLPTFDGTGAMYPAAATNQPSVWETVNWSSSTAVRALAAPLNGVRQQPACMAEQLVTLAGKPADGAQSGPQQLVPEIVYRITAQGYGMYPSTTAMVQSTYRRQ
ncbi:MAG TPA: PilX N-terminal domain-containing pilus assembly protein [Burkholderiaceae bacterium]|nr:PilX N-terminal domain-containing pilus assembly protein [Burkholderiaceae bacterium]